LKALQYVKTFQGVIIQIPEDTSIAKHGLMNEGIQSTQLGMQGKPGIAESILIQRDLELLEYTKSTLHLTGISTKKSVDLIRRAKKQGLQVTCSTTPYHLLYTDADLKNYNSIFKINPPLRTETDRQALIKGVEDGTIDCIATHHFPQDWDAKHVEFEYAKPGMIGLQTTLNLLLTVSDKIPLEKWIAMMSTKPREILGLPIPQIKEDEPACLTIFNTNQSWHFDEQSNRSRSSNSPVFEQELKGKILAVINNNQLYIHE